MTNTNPTSPNPTSSPKEATRRPTKQPRPPKQPEYVVRKPGDNKQPAGRTAPTTFEPSYRCLTTDGRVYYYCGSLFTTFHHKGRNTRVPVRFGTYNEECPAEDSQRYNKARKLADQLEHPHDLPSRMKSAIRTLTNKQPIQSKVL